METFRRRYGDGLNTVTIRRDLDHPVWTRLQSTQVCLGHQDYRVPRDYQSLIQWSSHLYLAYQPCINRGVPSYIHEYRNVMLTTQRSLHGRYTRGNRVKHNRETLKKMPNWIRVPLGYPTILEKEVRKSRIINRRSRVGGLGRRSLTVRSKRSRKYHHHPRLGGGSLGFSPLKVFQGPRLGRRPPWFHLVQVPVSVSGHRYHKSHLGPLRPPNAQYLRTRSRPADEL